MRRHFDVGLVERGYRRTSEQLDRAHDIRLQDLDRARHPRPSGRTQTVMEALLASGTGPSAQEHLDRVADKIQTGSMSSMWGELAGSQ